MKVTAHLTDGSELTIHDFDAETILGLGEELREPTSGFLTFEMDDATVIVNRDQVVRFDIDGSDEGQSPLDRVLDEIRYILKRYHEFSPSAEVQSGIDLVLSRLDLLLYRLEGGEPA